MGKRDQHRTAETTANRFLLIRADLQNQMFVLHLAIDTQNPENGYVRGAPRCVFRLA